MSEASSKTIVLGKEKLFEEEVEKGGGGSDSGTTSQGNQGQSDTQGYGDGEQGGNESSTPSGHYIPKPKPNVKPLPKPKPKPGPKPGGKPKKPSPKPGPKGRK